MMDIPNDTYKTILEASEEILFKEKKSKFYGIAYPIEHENQVKPLIEALKKKHHTANHVCYAWQLGVEHISYRANDDGEPNNAAGMPIYGQIQSFEVTNILIAVTRIFGGTKLGVGGLISAYREAAQMALHASKIVERTLRQKIELQFEYPNMDMVMRTIKQQQLEIVLQKLEINCQLVVSVQKSRTGALMKIFDGIYGVKTKLLES